MKCADLLGFSRILVVLARNELGLAGWRFYTRCCPEAGMTRAFGPKIHQSTNQFPLVAVRKHFHHPAPGLKP